MVVLITGASRGLGASLAKIFAEAGHTVYAGDYGGEGGGLPLDITKESDIAACAKKIEAECGKLDILINNAGVITGIDVPITEFDPDEFRACMEINLIGAMLCVKHMLPLMQKSGSATIVNISSEAGSLTGHPGIPYSYTISKGAMNIFTRILHNQYGKDNLKVVSVHPGRMMTDMGKPHFTLHPDDSARGILKIAEGKVDVGEYQFVDYAGNIMPI